MKAAPAHEIKHALKELDAKALTELCLRLARYKKENKELLTFLLFEAHDLQAYVKGVNEKIDDAFGNINTSNVYFATKGVRKALRIANKYIRYSGSKTAEVEVLLHFFTNFKGLKVSWQKSVALSKVYKSGLKKIEAAIGTLHEDLQYDYRRNFNRLSE